MNTLHGVRQWVPALGATFLLAAASAPAAVTMEGAVALDYYVADVDEDGFELVDAAFDVESIRNSGSQRSGPLSLSGWATTDATAAGAGDELGYLPVGTLGGGSTLFDVGGVAPADDVRPGEYYTHVLLQDDSAPGTWEDVRSLTPRLLWRGGLEAVGPLAISQILGRNLHVEFAELRNNRLDSRMTNDIELTLYATFGFGPASEGYTLCRVVVPGLYAGDYRFDPDFTCRMNDVPNGEYTVHLDVAELGGRGGFSTLSGPDVRFLGGSLDDGYVDGEVYVSGGLGAGLLLPLGILALARRRILRRVAAAPAVR